MSQLNNKAELVDLNLKIGEAEKQRDVNFLSSVLADDLAFRKANGTVVNKKQFIEYLEKGKITYDCLLSSDIEVIFHQDLALVSLIVCAIGMSEGKRFSGEYLNTRLFLKNEAGWQCFLWFNVKK